MYILYSIAKAIMTPVVRLLFSVRCRGRKNIPESGAVIIASNHVSALDMFFIMTFFKRKIRFLAKSELFRTPILNFFFRSAGAIPINRAFVGAEPIKEALEALSKNEVIGIFPQGTRCRGVDPKSTRPKNGVGMLSYRSGACVLPVYIGAKDMKPRIFRRTDVIFGKPIDAGSLDFSEGGSDEYRRASEYIFDEICALGENHKAEETGK